VLILKIEDNQVIKIGDAFIHVTPRPNPIGDGFSHLMEIVAPKEIEISRILATDPRIAKDQYETLGRDAYIGARGRNAR